MPGVAQEVSVCSTQQNEERAGSTVADVPKSRKHSSRSDRWTGEEAESRQQIMQGIGSEWHSEMVQG